MVVWLALLFITVHADEFTSRNIDLRVLRCQLRRLSGELRARRRAKFSCGKYSRRSVFAI